MKTDLPAPVVPATSKCGVAARSMTAGSPYASLPIAIGSLKLGLLKCGDFRTSSNMITSRGFLGTSIPIVDYATGDANKRFFEMICQHGVMRRVGTTFNVVKGEGTAVFETRVG